MSSYDDSHRPSYLPTYRDLNISTSSQHDKFIDYDEMENRVNLLVKRQSESSSALNHVLASPPPSSTPSSSSSRQHQTKSLNRRKIIDNDQEYQKENVQMALPEKQDYPIQKGDEIILGPNGTEVNRRSYGSINWLSAAAATRQLLDFVFSGDILATHTLTGKPSPVFYGCDRPTKMQLDPIKTADIIHCVRSKCKCSEREIRAAIRTKCYDTSRKYKRLQQKQLESMNAID